MAILKRRLHRNNGSGYDTVHFETEAKLVLMSDGTSAEAAINAKAPAGFGLGDRASLAYSSSADDINKSGWYIVNGNDEMNWGWYMLMHIQETDPEADVTKSGCFQLGMSLASTSSHNEIAVRWKDYGIWTSWNRIYSLADDTDRKVKVGRLYHTIDDGVYVRAIEGAKEEDCGVGNGDLYLNYRRPNNTIYMGGNGNSSNVAIHSGNIGSYTAGAAGKAQKSTADVAVTSAALRDIMASTADLTAGSTGLTTGVIYLVYE